MNRKIDHYPPITSLKRARTCVWIGVAVTLATTPLIPASLIIPIVALPLWGYAAWFLAKLQSDIDTAQAELGKRRGFIIRDMNVPRKIGRNGAPLPAYKSWPAEWVPYQVVKVEESYRSGPATVWRKELRVSRPWLQVLDQQRAWLQQHAPERWRVISIWWEQWFLRPLLIRRHGSAACSERAIDAAAQDQEVELRIGITIGGQPSLWNRRLGFGTDESDAYASLSAALGRLPRAVMNGKKPAPEFPRYRQPEYDYLFIGRGFMWDAEHTQKIEDLKLRNLAEVTTDPQEQGDPRIYGIGHRQAKNLFMDEAQFNQMAGIFGSTGVGKTRYAEVLLVQVVRNGMPLLVIDPKGDQALTNRIVEECRRAGRGHQFRYFCLAAPTDSRTWRYLARYNPCYTYTDPAELAARVASVLPATKDPFWTNVAKAMVENCLTLCHWTNWYLRFISRARDRSMPAKESHEVPRLLLAMQWARHHAEASPAQADAAVERILGNMRADPVWTARTADERDIVDLVTTKSLAGVRIYAPIEWIPTVRHVNEYEIDNTIAFLGWMLKIFFFHTFLASSKSAQANFPRLASNQEIVAKGGRGNNDEASMWSAYQNTRFHPLEVRYEANADLGPEQKRWLEFYDYYLPEPADEEQAKAEHYELGRMFKAVRIALESHYSDATRERQKFLEYATTLQSAIKPFLGERSRIMCSVDSDIVWSTMIREKQVVYCALGSMIDDNGAASCAKMIIQDIAAYFGRRYQYEGGKADPVYVFADEVSSFINEPFIQLLNKCRGVGLRAVIAGQTRADLAKQLGKEGAQQAMGNINTVIQLRSPLDEDAKEFAGRAGDAKIIQENRSLSTTPGVGGAGNVLISSFSANESRSYQQQSVKRVPPEAVLALPRGQAFVHAKGQVFLLAQGLLEDPQTNVYEEIGMHAGVMLETIRPVSEAIISDRTNADVIPASAVFSSGASTRQPIEPSLPIADESRAITEQSAVELAHASVAATPERALSAFSVHDAVVEEADAGSESGSGRFI
jgi:hypothetical protein